MEDEVLIRLHLAEELRSVGYTVFEAASGDEAITLLSSVDSVGLVLTDVRMPGSVDGIALARWIRSNFPLMKVVLVSTAAGSGTFGEFDVCFPKPVRFDDLLHSVRQLLPRSEQGSSSDR